MEPIGAVGDVVGSLRVQRLAGNHAMVRELLDRMIQVSISGLPLMYRQDIRGFCYTRRRQQDGSARPEGESLRYGAIVLLGARYLGSEEQKAIFHGQTAMEFCHGLVSGLSRQSRLGDIALTAWAAAELQHPMLSDVLGLLRAVSGATCDCYTVEAAWVLSALVAARNQASVEQDVQDAADRLLRAFHASAGVFPHRNKAGDIPWYRRHVACFADQVYPIQALARYHHAFGNRQALEAANRCAAQICHVQGNEGQWWWHYDARTGAVIEGYPVYSVHQDAMGPMALLDLYEAGGDDHAEAIRRGVLWMGHSPEVGRSLIDEAQSLIWRKVARAEPWKMTRSIRAGVSRAHSPWRLRALDHLYRPRAIDYESRPYHLGWILHAWLGGLV